MPNEPPTSLVIDAHLMLLKRQMLGEQVLHHVRRLRALVDSEALFARIPVGHDGARLVADAGVAAEYECRLDHRVGVFKALVGIAGGERSLEAEIVADLRLDHRRRRIERGLGVGDRRKFLVSDLDQFAGVLGLGARTRDHRAHRLSRPARAVDRDGVLRRRFEPLEMGEHPDPRRDDIGELNAGDDREHARRFLRRGGVDRRDARVGVRRAHEGGMRHAR